MPDTATAPDADTIETVRVAVYATFAGHGRAPTVPELSASESLAPRTVRQSLAALHRVRSLVLSPAALVALAADSDAFDTHPRAIVMAHPFATIPLGFSVMGKDTLWWGGCCWDSFALPHLLPEQAPMLIATTCPGCDLAMAFRVSDHCPPLATDVGTQHGTAVAHFLLPVQHMWDDVVHTCANQRIFCDPTCVDRWAARTDQERGYVMSLDVLWDFARGWYAGRLARGYVRREPAQAKEYFRSVGLHGTFWGL